ncbi:MAG TPA: VWA domain-containing protein [Acidobacteriota bacterium]|nr:VWA domain-containing protein [Acidobacteriota bacterium]
MKAAVRCVRSLNANSLGAVVSLIFTAMMLSLPFAEPLRTVDEKQPAKASAQTVVIDVVARDKKGNPVTDLKESDVEIQEDGAKQKIAGFRFVGPDAQSGISSGDPLQKIKLVTMVFQNQFKYPESQDVARKVFQEFLDKYPGGNMVVGMFTIDNRFYIVQQYTNKKEYLREALDKAIAQDYEPLQRGSDAIQKGLAAIAGGASPAESVHALGGTGNQQLDARLAQISGKMLSGAAALATDQGGWRTVLYSLQSVAKEQQVIPGRKTMLYYAGGLWIPRENLDQVARLEGIANNAHVSIYPVYLGGLSASSQAKDSVEALHNAIKASESETRGGAVGTWGVRAGESGESSISANPLEALSNLGKATSGILMGDSNDFKTPMQAIFNDIDNYYEVSYMPQNAQYDGKYRRVSVKISKAKTVLARNGYFATPPSAGEAPAPPAYEAPLLALLEQPSPPHTFDYRLRVPHFDSKNGFTRHVLLMEVPMGDFTFTEDPKAKVCRSQFALMAVFKDTDGKIAEKISQFYPLEVPPDRVEAYKKSNILLSREIQLPQGKYTIESVAYDKPSEKSSAMKSSLEVPAAADGLQISSLSIIKKTDPINPNDTDTGNPFRLGNRKIMPFAEDPVRLKVGSPLQMYMVVYPDPRITDKPQMRLQIFLEGNSLAELPADLPAVDPQGRIQYTGTLPTNSFAPGQYELKVVITHGSNHAETKTGLIMVP